MHNTIATEKLREYVKENEVELAKGNKGTIKKGDTFVQYQPRHTMIFMKVNDVEHTESMDFCTVTWYMLDARGLNVQSRFPMAAPDGVFYSFVPVDRKIHKEAVALMRDFDAKMAGASSDSEKKSLAQKVQKEVDKDDKVTT